MAIPSGYTRISDLTGISCPICSKRDWCLMHKSGLQVICARVPSKDARGGAGWAHSADAGPIRPVNTNQRRRLTAIEVQEYWDGTDFPGTDPLIVNMATILGVRPAAVKAMHGGYDTSRAVLTFLMLDGRRRPTGVRFRRRDGRKFSLRGGREGVFMSRGFRPDLPVVVAEGPTDCAALVHAGFWNVLGLPNCCGGTGVVEDLLDGCPATPVLIVSDPDPPGQAGADRLAGTLRNPCLTVAGDTDIRDFITKYPSTGGPMSAIMEVVGGAERDDLRIIGRNPRGGGVNFKKAFERQGDGKC